MATADPTALLIAAQRGDRAALSAFIRATQRDVLVLCGHLVGRDAAADVAQDAYVRALRSLPAYRGEASARTWLLSIVRRTCADAVRSRVRRRRLRARLGASPAAMAADAADAAEYAGIDAVLSVLPADRKVAFVLTQLLGLPYADAASVCGVPVGTIRSRVARAREQLVAAVADEADGSRAGSA